MRAFLRLDPAGGNISDGHGLPCPMCEPRMKAWRMNRSIERASSHLNVDEELGVEAIATAKCPASWIDHNTAAP